MTEFLWHTCIYMFPLSWHVFNLTISQKTTHFLSSSIIYMYIFLPQTLWTNREVKLADVLGKPIVPVNFLPHWPPKCLAIQFSTTQFIPWPHSGPEQDWDEATVADVASAIVRQYQKETGWSQTPPVGGVIAADGAVAGEERDTGSSKGHRGLIVSDGGADSMEGGGMGEVEKETEKVPPLQRSQDTLIIHISSEEGLAVRDEATCKIETPTSPSLSIIQGLQSQRKSTIKSYASDLPPSLSEIHRQAIQESRQGKPLVLISCHTAQRDFGHELASEMEGHGYEVWCSCDVLSLRDESASPIFQAKADEAGVIIFVFSKEFTESSFCEKQVYYCEQRKRIVPLVYDPIQLPDWASMLIGTSPFVTRQSSGFRHTLLKRVEDALNPQKGSDLQEMLKEKAEIVQLCADITAKLPQKKNLVYISGGTKFFSKCGEQICKELGRLLAQDSSIVLVTGGYYGVGETVGRSFHEERVRHGRGEGSGVWHVVAERDDQDKSSQTRQNKDGTFLSLPYGQTIFAGTCRYCKPPYVNSSHLSVLQIKEG